MMKRFYIYIWQMLQRERCPRKLAISLAVSVFIAFSPFVGLHSVMAVAFSWIFTLNIGVLLAVSNSINNPWTMLPIYATDQVVGDNIFQLLGIDGMQLNPTWIDTLNHWLKHYTGLTGISFWPFLLGGNFLSILLAVVIYAVARYLLSYRFHSV